MILLPRKLGNVLFHQLLHTSSSPPTEKGRLPLPIKVSHIHAHCLVHEASNWCLSCPGPYLLTPITRGPHTGINLAETVPPNVKFGPDLVHHSAQFCQCWVCRRRMEMEQSGLTNQEAMSPGSGTTRQYTVFLGSHPLRAPPLHNGSPWLETNWVRIREQAACPASWAHSSLCCSWEPVG